MQKLKFIALTCVLAIITGCATYVDIKSETDVTAQVSPSKKIKVWYDSDGKLNHTIEERNFWFVMVDEMEKAGFNVVESGDVDYVLFYFIHDYSYDYIDTLFLPDTQTTYSYDAYGNQQRQTTYGTEYVPYTRYVNRRGIQMFLKANDETWRTVWTGTAYADYDDFNAHSKECVATLLQFFGDQHEGETKLIKRK